jgi:diguanylate cyclase
MPGVLVDLGFAVAMTASGMAAGWWLQRRLRRDQAASDEPRLAREVLRRLQELAQRMATNVGQHSSRVEEINQELTLADGQTPEAVVAVVAKLIDANHGMQHQLIAVEQKLHEQALLVELRAAEARTDALTGLANRRALDLALARQSARFQESGKTFCLVLSDIDHFKQFNDRHGHQAGDEVLRGVARALTQSARSGDLVARYGGEEFAVVLPDTFLSEATECAERIRRAVAESRFRCGADDLRVAMSFGVAELLPDEDASGLLGRADTALYAAKNAGRNRSAWHDGRMVRGVGTDATEESAVQAAGDASAGPILPVPVSHGTPPAGPQPAAPTDGHAAAALEMSRATCTRHEFEQALGRRVAEWRRGGAAPGLLLARVDHFAAIVARHGPDAGLLVLRSVRHFLEAAVRDMDTAGECGEAQFALLMPGVSQADLTRVAERLREVIARSALPLGGQRLSFTISAAVAAAAGGDDAAALMRRAEEALASAVQSGGNRTACHDIPSGHPAQNGRGRG